MISREGLHGATLRRIAAEAGCTTGSITHHFTGRDDLLIHILASACDAYLARIGNVARAGVSALAYLEAILLEVMPLDLARLREWKVWMAFWTGAAAGEVPLARENERRYRTWRGAIESALAPLCDSPEEAAIQASLLVALVDGLGLRLTLMNEDDQRLPGEQQSVAFALSRYLRIFAGSGGAAPK